MLSVVTIGVYGFDAESFLERLRHADTRLLLDLRQRRGVRGPAYAWAPIARGQAPPRRVRIAARGPPPGLTSARQLPSFRSVSSRNAVVVSPVRRSPSVRPTVPRSEGSGGKNSAASVNE